MTEQQMKQLAMDIVDGKVFGSWSLDEHSQSLTTCIFMPILFMNEEQTKKMKEDEVVHLYEYLDKAGPRCINGYPMFTSMAYITKKDWHIVRGYVKECQDRKDAFLKTENTKPKEDEGPTLFDEENDG